VNTHPITATFARLAPSVSAKPKRRKAPKAPVEMLPFERVRVLGSVVLQLPMHTVSEANMREHWRPKAARVRDQRRTVRLALDGHVPRGARGEYTVELTRFAPCRLDGDNLQRSLKAVRDEVAECIGIDDGDPCYEWVYRQERWSAYGVRVRVVAR
jgi:hypothetical protein